MPKYRRLHEKRGWAWTACIAVVKPTLLAVSKRRWIDGDKIPETGGCIIAVNHISHLDPMSLGHFLYEHGRLVRYLAKDTLWELPVLGAVVRNAKQIPVARMSTGAAKAYDAAVQALKDGELLGVYPEGTITKDPNGWPMRGKTGAARLALATGCPVIPVGQWGAQEVLPAYTKTPHLWPRHTTAYKVGDPVDLSEWIGQPLTQEVLRQATEKIMDAITELVADLRGEPAPAVRFDPKRAGVGEIGNPNRPQIRPDSGQGQAG